MIFLFWPALLLLPAAVWAWWQWGRAQNGRILRLLGILLLILAAAEPVRVEGAAGRDVILLLDQSWSVAERYDAKEMVALAASQRGNADRLSVIAVGAGALAAGLPATQGLPQVPAIDGSASDLAEGFRWVSSQIAPGREARVVLVSDGLSSGQEPSTALAALRAAGASLDVLPQGGEDIPDTAIVHLSAPPQVRPGEQAVLRALIQADQAGSVPWRLVRGEQTIAEGTLAVRAGQVAGLSVVDRPDRGLNQYQLELLIPADRQPGNNRAQTVLLVDGSERVLVLGGSAQGAVMQALTKANMHARWRSPENLSPVDLAGMEVLVLDQVPGEALGREGMQLIAAWVRAGGGLLAGGGPRSLGAGGWLRSPLAEVLPVDLEPRDERKRARVALVVALDRSGSMQASVAGGGVKMDLANAGTVAAIELLGEDDEIAVLAVDSEAQVVIHLTPLKQRAQIANQVRRIESQGGGIYVYEALSAAAALVTTSQAPVRHIVLFADAADAEEPGNWEPLVDRLKAAGVGVSVIGLGSERDSDAPLLQAIAKRAGGNARFTSDPMDLPRLFAQETVTVTRSAWLEQATTLHPEADLPALLGAHSALSAAWPSAPGINQAWIKPGAQILASAQADLTQPALAWWPVGAGRAAVMAVPFDDALYPQFPRWDGYGPLLSSLVRSLAPIQAAQAPWVESRLLGDTLQVTVWHNDASQVPSAHILGGGNNHHLALTPSASGAWSGSLRLRSAQPALPVVSLGGQVVQGAVQCLPYAAEFRPQPAALGLARLQELAQLGGGQVRSDLIGVFQGPPSSGSRQPLAWWCLCVGLLSLLLENTLRRLDLSFTRLAWPPQRARTPKRPKPAGAAPSPVQPAPQPSAGIADALNQARRRPSPKHERNMHP